MVSFKVPRSQTVSVNVSWTPGYSGGYDQEFSVHYRKIGSGSDFTQEFIGLPPTNMHTVQQLSPNTEYEFMMQASNQLGNSPTSRLTQVNTSGNKEVTLLLSIRTVIKEAETGDFPRLLCVALKEIASCFIPRLFVVFTRQVQILVISLIKCRTPWNKRPRCNKCPRPKDQTSDRLE